MVAKEEFLYDVISADVKLQWHNNKLPRDFCFNLVIFVLLVIFRVTSFFAKNYLLLKIPKML